MSQSPKTTPVVPTADEVFDSLTGHDEMAIGQHFGRVIGDLLVSDASMYARALIFVLKRRDGDSDDDARTVVLDMPMSEVMAYFATEEAAEVGKDERPSAKPPEPSPTGASEPAAAATST